MRNSQRHQEFMRLMAHEIDRSEAHYRKMSAADKARFGHPTNKKKIDGGSTLERVIDKGE